MLREGKIKTAKECSARYKSTWGEIRFARIYILFRSRKVAFIYAQMFVKKGHPSSIFRNERCLFFKGIWFKIENSKSYSF